MRKKSLIAAYIFYFIYLINLIVPILILVNLFSGTNYLDLTVERLSEHYADFTRWIHGENPLADLPYQFFLLAINTLICVAGFLFCAISEIVFFKNALNNTLDSFIDESLETRDSYTPETWTIDSSGTISHSGGWSRETSSWVMGIYILLVFLLILFATLIYPFNAYKHF